MTKPTNPTRTGVPQLPPPLRMLAGWDDYHRAVYAARDALAQFAPTPELDHGQAEEMVTAALAEAGVFEPLPDCRSLHPTCTALFLPHDRQEHPQLLGMWQQCAQDPGHPGDRHHSDEITWRDGQPGAVPAGTATEVRP